MLNALSAVQMRVNLDTADQGATISAEEMKLHLQSLLKVCRFTS